MNTFDQLGLPQPLLHALERMKFNTPTPIQALAIPPALTGRDILGSAQTGTGKTAAFSIPMIAKLLREPQGMALIMTPTRELAAQVRETVQQLLSAAPQLKTALLIGGQSMHGQLQQLRARPRIIIGTPGRINDHLQQNSLRLDAVNFLVLDETDRMLDMGFGPQIERIVRRVPRERQTLLFSATLPAEIVKAAQQYTHNPERVAVGSTTQPLQAIRQEQLHMAVADKYPALLRELAAREGSIIVFVRTKYGAQKMAKKLERENHAAVAIHGNLNQNQRQRALQAFRDKKFRVMVATDIAARGLDVPHIEHVINYDLPSVAEEYIHRIGRTARNGASGSALCFITPEDGELWGAIRRLLDPQHRSSAPESRNSGRHHNERRGNGRQGPRRGEARRSNQPRGEARHSNQSRGEERHSNQPRSEGRHHDERRGNGRHSHQSRGEPRHSNQPHGETRRSDQSRDHGRHADPSRGNGHGGRRQETRDGGDLPLFLRRNREARPA
jgi:superfamily II DNA/RNA helicase